MKKKIFNVMSLFGIAALLALNANVVLDDDASSYLEWGVISKVFASGSGSGSGSTTKYDNEKDCTITDPNTGLSKPGKKIDCDGSSGDICTEPVACY